MYHTYELCNIIRIVPEKINNTASMQDVNNTARYGIHVIEKLCKRSKLKKIVIQSVKCSDLVKKANVGILFNGNFVVKSPVSFSLHHTRHNSKDYKL